MKILFFIILSFSLIYSQQDFPEYGESFGYPVETHEITTNDGYILKFFRVQAKGTNSFSNSLKVILLQHGLTSSADNWILNSLKIERDVVFFFADNGYDVWVGNNRGTYYSRAHTRLNPDKDKKEFFDFSFKEMGKYDIPAAFSYISKITSSKINYIAHSQGTTQMFYALTQNIPEVENNLENFFALAPVAYLGNMSSPLIDYASKAEFLVVKTLSTLGFYELFWRGWLVSGLGAKICKIANFFCGSIIDLVGKNDAKDIDHKLLPLIMEHVPSGTSLKSLHHYGQLYTSNNFQDFDYESKEENQRHYNSDFPPQFPLSSIKKKIYAFAGDLDNFADKNDVKRLKDELGDNLDLTIYPDWGHASFEYADTTRYTRQIDSIIKGESQNLRRQSQ